LIPEVGAIKDNFRNDGDRLLVISLPVGNFIKRKINNEEHFWFTILSAITD
jgi:hypothetical protein